jgi:hypothetical protein
LTHHFNFSGRRPLRSLNLRELRWGLSELRLFRFERRKPSFLLRIPGF